MKIFGKRGLFILSLFVVALMLCGCGNAANKENGAHYNNALEESDQVTYDKASDYGSQSTGVADRVTDNRKIIEYIDLTVETKTFDTLINDINAAVKESGGYIENSEIGGNSYYISDRRTAKLKIRIPKTKQTDFSEFISKNCNVVNRSVNTEDVTDRYIDTQSRIKALTLEKETLEKLLTQSASLSDTLTVYERLTDVIADIESYQGKLNQMDNLIEYTTFTVYIDEVEKETNIKKQNWFEKTWNGLLDSFSDIVNGLLSFLSFIIIAIPYLVLLGIVATIAAIIIRHFKKKKGKKI